MAKHEIDMTRGSLLKNIIRFSIPLILTSTLQLFYNAADVIVVGQFSGKEALAAVGSTGSLSSLIINLFLGLSIGTSVLVSRYYGANDEKGMHVAVHTSIAISALVGCILLVLGVFLARPLLMLMGNPPDVIDGATIYMQIYFIGMPVNMIYNFGSAILRAVGDTRRPLYFLTISGIVNVILNLILVIVFHMGVAGVAIATVVSQALSAIFVLYCLIHSEGGIRLQPKKLAIDMPTMLQITKIGLPAGIQASCFSISNVLIQSSINSFGSDAVAGNSAAANLEAFIYCAMNAFYQAAVTTASQNLGAKQYARMRRALWVCIASVVVVGTVGGNLMYFFREALLSIYNGDPSVIAMGTIRMRYILPLYSLCGLMDLMTGQMRGMGYSSFPMVVSLTGVCLLRIVWIYSVFAMSPTLDTLYFSYPISWALTGLSHYACYLFVCRKLPKEDMPLSKEVQTGKV